MDTGNNNEGRSNEVSQEAERQEDPPLDEPNQNQDDQPGEEEETKEERGEDDIEEEQSIDSLQFGFDILFHFCRRRESRPSTFSVGTKSEISDTKRLSNFEEHMKNTK